MNRKHDFAKTARIQQRITTTVVEEGNGDTDKPGAGLGGQTLLLEEPPCRSRFKAAGGGSLRNGCCTPAHGPFTFEQAFRIQSAEFWLRLGEPLEALAEIECLPQSLRRVPRIHKLHAYAIESARTFQARSNCV
jgi:hypothetical protein